MDLWFVKRKQGIKRERKALFLPATCFISLVNLLYDMIMFDDMIRTKNAMDGVDEKKKVKEKKLESLFVK